MFLTKWRHLVWPLLIVLCVPFVPAYKRIPLGPHILVNVRSRALALDRATAAEDHSDCWMTCSLAAFRFHGYSSVWPRTGRVCTNRSFRCVFASEILIWPEQVFHTNLSFQVFFLLLFRIQRFRSFEARLFFDVNKLLSFSLRLWASKLTMRCIIMKTVKTRGDDDEVGKFLFGTTHIVSLAWP